MKRVKLVIMVGILMILGCGCTEISNKITETDSSTLTLNVNWDEAVANESTNKVIEDAITNGYKVYAGIIKSSEVDKSGTINFKEKQEISYRINKSIKFTIKESDYTKYHICIFIDKDGDGILSSWNHETIAYSYSVNIDSTSQTIDMPIKINNATSSSTLTFNVTWNETVSKKGVEKSIIDEAVSKGYKLYLGILKESEITKDEAVRCKIKQEIEYNKNREVIFNINESDYTKYQAYIYIDKNDNGFGDGLNGEIIAGLLDTITVNSVSQTIDVPVEVNSVTSSSKIKLNINWDITAENNWVNKAVINGAKLYAGIVNKNSTLCNEVIRLEQQKEINYKIDESIEFILPQSNSNVYEIYIYADMDNNEEINASIGGKYSEYIKIGSCFLATQTQQEISETIKLNEVISDNTSSTITFNVSWNKSSESLVTEEKIDEAIAKGYKLYLGLLKESEITRDGVVRGGIKQEIEYNKNKEVKFVMSESDYKKYQVYVYIDENGDGFGSGFDGEIIAGDCNINVTSNSCSVNLPIYIKE